LVVINPAGHRREYWVVARAIDVQAQREAFISAAIATLASASS